MNKPILFTLLLISTVFSQMSGYSQQEELVAVGINGALITPGTYRVSPDQRVLDVIKMANGGAIPALDTIDCRNVIVAKESGAIDTLDILRYLAVGDLSQNPYVTGGASIHLDYATRWVYVSGDLQGILVGDIPLKEGETAGELLSLFTLNQTANTDKILSERQGAPSKELSLMALDTVLLIDRDNLTVFPQKEQSEIFRVLITGEVQRPGEYLIEQSTTLASELVAKSGGATKLGNLEDAWVIRLGKQERLPQQDIKEGTESVKKEVTASISNAIISGDYMIIPLANGEIALEDGDELVVPKQEHVVYVSGLVKKPGGYPYIAGEKLKYYVKQAGGYARSANKKEVRTVQSYGNVYRTVDQNEVGAGDLIIVPERDKEARTRLVLAFITAMATTLTALVTFTAFVQK